jgi:hypothetical protein
VGIFTASILCWTALILIILNTHPTVGGKNIIIFFFISLFFALVGTFSLIGFYLRLWFSKNELIYSHLGPAIRQAILISLCIIVLLGLQILRLVNIWTGILVVLAILSLEFFFRTKKEKVKNI